MRFLRLIRFSNLLMIALVQYLVRYTIIIPILEVFSIQTSISEINFFLLVLSTVCIAAGGYIINDYHDLPIDFINDPIKVEKGLAFCKKWCYKLYLMFSSIGLLLGFYLSFLQNIDYLWLIHFLSVGLLYIYSTYFKKIFIAGNLVISFLAGLSVILVLLIDKNAMHENIIRKLVLGYALFAFLLTLVREIIKDIEDKEGDTAFGRKTLPIVMGNTISKLFASFFVFMVLFLLGALQYSQKQWEDKVSFFYVVFLIEIPLVLLLIFLIRANHKKDFHKSSMLSKGIMLTGVLSMLVFYLHYK